MQAAHVRGAVARGVAHTALHDEGEALVVLQEAHVSQRVAVDQQKVGEVARLHRPSSWPRCMTCPPIRVAACSASPALKPKCLTKCSRSRALVPCGLSAKP